MMTTLYFLYSKLSRSLKAKTYLLFLLVIGMAILETAGVGGFLPLLSILTKPELIHTNEYLQVLYDTSGVTSDGQFLFLIGIAFLFLFLIKTVYTGILYYFKIWYGNRIVAHYSNTLMEIYMTKPYTYFLGSNSAVLLRNVTNEVKSVGNAIKQVIDLSTDSLIVVGIIAVTMFIDPYLTAIGGAFVALSLWGLTEGFKKKIAHAGTRSVESLGHMFQNASEALQGIKTIKAYQRENFFLSGHFRAVDKYVSANLTGNALTQLPALAFEGVVYCGMFSVVFYVMVAYDSFVDVLPIIGVYVIAIQRTLPAVKRLYGATAWLYQSRASLNVVRDACAGESAIREVVSRSPVIAAPSDSGDFTLKGAIEISDVSYSYQGANNAALSNVSLTIAKNTSVGLVGTSGSGKTTLVDILLGLLPLQSRKILVGGKAVWPWYRDRWLQMIGYIPQNVFLMDSSVRMNIAFGIPEDQICEEQLRAAIRVAQLEEVIKNLPDGWNTRIGERGVKLSGGQRQRIGIARAIYHNPEILVLDEATSALDGKTEAEFQNAILSLSGKKTLIIVAHRITTVKHCDQICIMEYGKIIERGTFNQLMKFSKRFQDMGRVA